MENPIQGPTFTIGKNAEDNTRLVLASEPHDVWFHVQGMTSAHLVYKNPDNLSLDDLRSNGTIYRMAVTLKQRSKYRKIPTLPMDYCYINDVTTTSTPGLVTIVHGKVMNV
jgi:predicted ribosome quality control (RQC) complex YloA/Tae2 family protein